MPKRIKEDSLSKTIPPSTQLQKYKTTKVNQHNNDRFIIIIVTIITYSVHRPCQSVFSRVRISVSAFKFVHLLISLRSSSSCSRHFPRLLAPSIFPSKTCFRRQFLSKMCPIQLAVLRLNEGTESHKYDARNCFLLVIRVIFSVRIQVLILGPKAKISNVFGSSP
jgi:hypothetical protein